MTGIDGMVTREQLIVRIFALKRELDGLNYNNDIKRELVEAKETINGLNYNNDRLKHLIKGLNYTIKQLKDGK